MKEANKFRPKRRNKINDVNKNILGTVTEVARERPTKESCAKAN